MKIDDWWIIGIANAINDDWWLKNDELMLNYNTIYFKIQQTFVLTLNS